LLKHKYRIFVKFGCKYNEKVAISHLFSRYYYSEKNRNE